MIGTVSLLVELEPALHRLLGVVVALHDVPAAHVARPVVLRRHVHVVHAPQFSQTRRPAMRSRTISVGTSRSITRSSGCAVEDPVELLGLRQRAREAVEHEAVLERAAACEALLDDADDDLVGHELAAVHVAAWPRGRTACPAAAGARNMSPVERCATP